MASSSLVTLLDITKDDTNLDIVIHAAGGKASTVAELALSRLRSTLISRAPRANDVYVYVDVMNHFAGGQGPLRRALLRNGGIAVVLDALFKMLKMLADTNAQTENAGHPPRALVAGFRFMQNVTTGRDGIVAIRVAIQQGLLQALIDTSSLLHHFTKEEQSNITLFLTKIIPTYLVYGSVVSVFHAALARLKNKAKIYSLTPKDAWMLLMKRYTLGRVITLQTDTKGWVTCGNTNCNRQALKQSIKRCPRCQDVYYCSKECQTAHWKAHKRICTLHELQNQTFDEHLISKTDVKFYHALVRYEIMQNIAHLRTFRTSYPDIPLAGLAVRADHTTIPPIYTVFPLEKPRDAPEGHPYLAMGTGGAISEDIIELAMKSGGKITPVQAVSGRGMGAQTIVMLVPSPWDEETQGQQGSSASEPRSLLGTTRICA